MEFLYCDVYETTRQKSRDLKMLIVSIKIILFDN